MDSDLCTGIVDRWGPHVLGGGLRRLEIGVQQLDEASRSLRGLGGVVKCL